MSRTIHEQGYVKGGGRITLGFVAIILLTAAFSSPALACKVNEVSIYAGKTQAEADAHDYDGMTMYITLDDDAYFRAECDDVDNPDCCDLSWSFDFDNDGTWDYDETTTYDVLYCVPPDPPNPWTYDSAEEYFPEVKVELDGVSGSSASATCKVTVMKVEIYDPAPSEFPKYIGIDTSLYLAAEVTPSSASGGEFTWSKVSGPGTVTLWPSNKSWTFFSADTEGSYTVKVEYTIGGVTCSDTSGTIEVCNAKMIFKTGEPPTETSSLTRTESGTFEVVDKDGNPIDGATYSNWAFDGEVDVSDPSNTSRTWSGTIVQTGKASCTVTFGTTTCEVNKSIVVYARSGWSITPSCAEDNDSTWGKYIGSVSVSEGCNKDRDSETGWIIVPRGTNFENGYSTAQVTSGPNKNVWYISGSTFKIDHETLINKFLKPGTTGYPDPPNINLHEYNESQSVDADGFLQAVINHEGFGTGANRNGHQAFLEDEEAKPGNDAKTEIEDNVASTKARLKSNTGSEVAGIDNDIYGVYSVEPTGNWSGSYNVYNFGSEFWDSRFYGI